MIGRTLLQPGQIWTPENTTLPSRQILDFPEDLLLYKSLQSPPQIQSTPTDGTEFICSRSMFRRWIRENNAGMSVSDDAQAAPSIELAKKIVALRKSEDMSQYQLAEALGLSRSAVASIETGRGIARKHVPKLAALFKIPPTFFLAGMVERDTKITVTIDEEALIDLYRRLPPEFKISVQKYTERQLRKVTLEPDTVDHD